MPPMISGILKEHFSDQTPHGTTSTHLDACSFMLQLSGGSPQKFHLSKHYEARTFSQKNKRIQFQHPNIRPIHAFVTTNIRP